MLYEVITSYFSQTYDSFKNFAKTERTRELFYDVQVVHHVPTDTYFTIGESLDAAIQEANINSAMYRGLEKTATNLLDNEGGIAYLKAAEFAVDGVKGYF